MKHLVSAAILSAAFAGPATSMDLGNMSAEERQIFRDEVRAYLLDNPEVLMEAIGVLEERQQAAQGSNDQTLVQANAQDLFNDENSYVGGNPDGDVVIVEFLDYKCGYCKRAHPEVGELLRSDGNIRYIIKEFPILGDESVLASRFAISVLQNAGPQEYARAHDNLMTMRGNYTEQTLRRLAGHLGLDADAVMDGMNAPSVDEIISENRALAQRMQISGTPSFVMGDQMLRGYVPLDGMQQIVAEIRDR